MFNDILDSRPIPKEIVKAAREWVEYELNRVYGKRNPIYVPSLQGEAERMLTYRLGKKWKMKHKVEIRVNGANGRRDITVIIKDWD